MIFFDIKNTFSIFSMVLLTLTMKIEESLCLAISEALNDDL